MTAPSLCIISTIRKKVAEACKLFKEEEKRIKHVSLIKNANTPDITQAVRRTVKFQLALSYADRTSVIAWFS